MIVFIFFSFIWDKNPLTFWCSPKSNKTANIPYQQSWIVELFLGQAKAVRGFVIMGLDSGFAEVKTFDVIIINTNKQIKHLGPFKVSL